MIDARGYSCPMPVVMVQKEVKANAPQTLEAVSYTHLTFPLSAMTRRRRVAQCAADTTFSLPPMFWSTSEAAFL